MNENEPTTRAMQINPSTNKVTSWDDLTDREKFDATSDDVEIYIERLKMENGCPTSPVVSLDDETPPVLKTITKYTIQAGTSSGYSWDRASSNLLFDTPEEAENALALVSGFIKEENSLSDLSAEGIVYQNGTIKRWSVHPVILITQETYDTHVVSIERANSAKNKNSTSRTAYNKILETTNTLVSAVYEERRDIGAKASVFAQIIRTWTDYLETSGGDAKTAASFLIKAFPDKMQVKAAFLWEVVEIVTGLDDVYEFGKPTEEL